MEATETTLSVDETAERLGLDPIEVIRLARVRELEPRKGSKTGLLRITETSIAGYQATHGS